MAGAAVKLENVTVVFNRDTPNETVALNNVNLEIPPGDVVVVLGGNGSGKSTLLKVIAGIYRPTQGKVSIDGHDVTKQKDYLRARKLSFVHQDPLLGTAPSLPLFANMALAGSEKWWLPLPYGLKLAKTQETALENTGLKLKQRLHIPLTDFSGGQRQAIAISIAFSRRARLVLLDEFTASLDRDTSQRVANEAIKNAETTNATTMMVMHDIDLADSLHCKSFFIHEGRVTETK